MMSKITGLFNFSEDVKKLSFGFFFIFLGYNSIQQYLTNYFFLTGFPRLGYFSLSIIYLFFILGSLISPVVVARVGPKKAMTHAVAVYGMFILIVGLKIPALLYLFSALLGIAAALLWTGQNSYLISISPKNSYGKNVGFFGTLLVLGTSLGIPLFGLLAAKASFSLAFLLFSTFPIFGLLLLLRLKETQVLINGGSLLLIKKTISSPTALKLAFVFLASYFTFGLAIGFIPLDIKDNFGFSYVGPLTSLFFIVPLLLTYYVGSLSDKLGRLPLLIILLAASSVGLLLLFFSTALAWYLLGIILLSLGGSSPIIGALIGDVAESRYLPYLTASVLIAENVGVVTALFFSSLSQTRHIYLLGALVLSAAVAVCLFLNRRGVRALRVDFTREVSS
ncbi:MAG: MFS transporter [Patescibacteria group bacterium]